MKSIPQLISETQDALRAKNIDYKEAIKGVTTEEQRLNALKALAAKHNIKESVEIKESRPARVMRKNGSGIHESQNLTEDEKIFRTSQKMRMTLREAAIYLGKNDPGPGFKLSKEFTESLAEKWRHYGAAISESEIQTLAERGIEP